MIIGAMKCGTTSLVSYLKWHPEICPARTKEPEFFSENQSHGVAVENYGDLWDFDRSIHKYALEASTGYTKYSTELNVPKSIFDYGIKPKFIYIIRNPFDRIPSHFNYMQRNKAWKLNIDDEHLIDTNNYFVQLEQYRRYFPKESILILDFDDLKNTPKSAIERVYQFLGLKNGYFPDRYEVRNQTKTKSQIETRLTGTKAGRLMGMMPSPLKKAGVSMLRKVSPAAEKRVLDDAETEIVFKALHRDMQNLRESYGVDVSKWGF